MPVNGLSTGIDHRLVFNDVNGVPFDSVIIESFTAKEDAVIDKKIAMDGNIRNPKYSQGWSGSFMVQRSNNSVDKYIAAQEAAYYRGVDQVMLTISETITEADGTVSKYQYTNVAIALADGGTWSGTETVTQNLNFQASRKLPRQ